MKAGEWNETDGQQVRCIHYLASTFLSEYTHGYTEHSISKIISGEVFGEVARTATVPRVGKKVEKWMHEEFTSLGVWEFVVLL